MTMSNPYGPILIVEDVPNVLELLEVTLRFKGYAVITARNALLQAAKIVAEGGDPLGANDSYYHIRAIERVLPTTVSWRDVLRPEIYPELALV